MTDDALQPLVAAVRRRDYEGAAENASEGQEGRHRRADEDVNAKLGDADAASCAAVVSPTDTS